MTMIPPILADINWVKVIFFVFVFVIGPILSHLGKNAQEKAKGPQPQRPQPRPPRPAAGGPLPDEIQRVLMEAQRAAQDANEAKQKKEAAKQRPAQRPQPKSAARRGQPGQRAPLRSTVTQHVQDHIASHPVSESSRSLGRTLAQADEQVESHLHQTFDHQLGDLASDASATANRIEEGTDSAAWRGLEDKRIKDREVVQRRRNLLVGMVRDREQLRHAFILSEVLRSPISDDD